MKSRATKYPFKGHEKIVQFLSFGDEVYVASQRLYPTMGQFAQALASQLSVQVEELDPEKFHTEWIRGCVCAEMAEDGRTFHWEAGADPNRHRGVIKCWRYGEWE